MVNLLLIDTEHLTQVQARVARYRAQQANELARKRWVQELQAAMTSIGARPLLRHVNDSRWRSHCAANDDAFTAVLIELQGVEG